MKIRELFTEATGNLFHITMVYEFICFAKEAFKIRQNVEELNQKIKQKAGKGTNCHLGFTGNSFSIRLSIPENEIDSIPWYRDDVISVLNEFIGMDNITPNDDDDRCEIMFNRQLPKLSHKINFPAIYFIPSSAAYLNGIANMVGECNYLEIENCEEIRGNVLGLIKLAKKGMVVNTSHNGNILPWQKIIDKHLIKSKQDIMDCQEELMNAGLEAYAQL